MGSITGEKPNRLLAYSIYICRNPGMTREDHHNHVTQVNTPMIIPLLEKYGAISYTISHNDSSIDTELQRLDNGHHSDGGEAAIEAGSQAGNDPGADTEHEMSVRDLLLHYDTVITITIPNIEVVEKMRRDPIFLEKFMPDHGNFADMTRARFTLGWIENYSFQ